MLFRSCADDLVQYKGGMGFLYCPGRRLLCTLEIFYPKQRFERETLLAFFASVSCSSNVAPEAPLNIIIIGLEPLGTRYMSLYGYPSRTTPALESFAQSGVVFRNAISPSSWTLPVFMSLFTSTYPSQHKLVNKYSVYTKDQQVLSDLRALSPRIVTLAQILQAQGYATAAFTGGAGVSKDFGYDAGFDVYYETPPFGGLDELVPKAVQWLKEQTGKKTFVFIMAYDLHGRYPLSSARHKALVRKLGKKFIGDVDSYWQYREKSVDKAMPALSQKDVQSWQTWYAEKIREADEKIGRFFRTLQDQGVFDHTVVVVTAGSGNEFYEHGKFDHGHSLYDELIKVPLIMRIPGVGKTAVEGQVRIIDVMPTLLDLARIVPDERVKRQMQGVSLLPMLRGKPLPLDAFSETDYLYNTFKRSLRTSDAWKFIYSLDSGDRELYDLKTDPLERRNLVESEPARAYELEQRLFDWMHSMGTDRHAHWKLLKRVLQTSQ